MESPAKGQTHPCDVAHTSTLANMEGAFGRTQSMRAAVSHSTHASPLRGRADLARKTCFAVEARVSDLSIRSPLRSLSEETGGKQEDVHTGNIKVCIRVRPFNQRELDLADRRCVSMPDRCTTDIIDASGQAKFFTFDRSYWSFDNKSIGAEFASQDTLMKELGDELVNNVLDGYNSCLFAYGQTGAGKTFSVIGDMSRPDSSGRGLLPRIIEEVFDKLERRENPESDTFTCGVTYMEIYNEQIRDLLRPPKATPEVLTVRSSPTVGVYVQGLQDTPVTSKEDVKKWLDFGLKARTIGAHCMNEQSSRSHCVFTMEVKRKIDRNGTVSHLRARVNLVDLAGSERQAKTHAEGTRLKEGSAINKSLTNLAIVINKLAELSSKSSKGKADFVPFRNSKLTFVLQDSLSGNSKTVMIAALSPGLSNYDESLSTLRFAESVKTIKTTARKNTESAGNIIAELQAEVERLRAELGEGDKHKSKEAAERRHSLKQLIGAFGRDAESEHQLARERELQRQAALEHMGLTLPEVAESCGMGKGSPQLVNVSSDSSLEGCLVYFLPEGKYTTIGSSDDCTITLTGLGIKANMATVHNEENVELEITKGEGRVLVNGGTLDTETMELRDGDRLIFGFSRCFRVSIPLAPCDSSAHATMSLEQMVGEFIPEQSEQYQRCFWYVDQLSNRLGTTRAQVFLLGLKEMVALVDEANAISDEVRPRDRFHFTVEATVDLYHYNEEVPECIVRMNKWETGVQRWRNVIRRHIMTRKRSGLEIFFRLRDKSNRPYVTLAMFTMEAFRARVMHLRTVYDSFQRGDMNVSDPSRPETDPWSVTTVCELARAFEPPSPVESSPTKDEFTLQLSQLQEDYDREKDALGRLQEAYFREKMEMKARITDLEREIALLRHGRASLSSTGSANGSEGPIPNTSLKGIPFNASPARLRSEQRHAEDLAAMQTAERLMARLQNVKFELKRGFEVTRERRALSEARITCR